MTEQRLDPDVIQREVSVYLGPPLEIQTQLDYEKSAQDLIGIKLLSSKIDGAYKPILESIQDSLKKTREIRDGYLVPLKLRREQIESARGAYEQKIDLERAQHSAKAIEVSTKAMEANRESLEAMGLDEAAAVLVPLPVPPLPPVLKTKGVSSRQQWGVVIEDMAALIRAVAEGKAPRECLLPNEVFLNSMVRVSKSSLAIPGVKPTFKKITNVRPR